MQYAFFGTNPNTGEDVVFVTDDLYAYYRVRETLADLYDASEADCIATSADDFLAKAGATERRLATYQFYVTYDAPIDDDIFQEEMHARIERALNAINIEGGEIEVDFDNDGLA